MIHLLHDLQEVCQSLNYVKHNEKHVSGGVTLLSAVLDYGAECTASALP